MPELIDVDTVEDLNDLRTALRTLPTPCLAQAALLAWLEASGGTSASTLPRIPTDA